MTETQVPYINLGLQHQGIKTKLLAAAEKVLDSGQFIMGPEPSVWGTSADSRPFSLTTPANRSHAKDNP